jgi:LysR family transcriptional regulator, transcriptional activator of nhaA
MALNYNHLFYFHVAALEGSVAAAAQRLGVTAATVSEQLRTLERSLGRDLFERTQAGLKLTDAGRITLEHTSPMFRLGDRLMQQLGERAEPAASTLRVGLSIGLARTATVELVGSLFALPDTVPSIRTSECVELLRDLRGGLLDLVLCESAPDAAALRGLQMSEVMRMPLAAIASPCFAPAADWRDAKLLHYRPTSPFRNDIETFLAANDLAPAFGGEADDGLLLIASASQPGYIAIVPQALAEEALAAGRVQKLRNVEPSSAAIHAIFPDTVPARRAVDLLRTTSTYTKKPVT